jgi:hypothetical protein
VETVDEELCLFEELWLGRGNSDARCTVVVHEAQMWRGGTKCTASRRLSAGSQRPP